MENSLRKAYTPCSFGMPSDVWAGSPAKDPTSLSASRLPIRGHDAPGALQAYRAECLCVLDRVDGEISRLQWRLSIKRVP
jgi:hypothetical protein